jgi:poly(3-hydroxybutyrate) depolymerase
MALLLAPQHARIIASAGWHAGDVQRFLFEHARNPLSRLRDAGEYDPVKTPQVAAEYGDPADLDTRVPVFAAPDRLILVVTGGDSGGFSTVVPAWAASVSAHRFIDADGSYSKPRAQREEVPA